MQRPLLGVFPGQPDVFIQVEAGYPGGIDLPRVRLPGQVFVQPRRRIAGGQAENVGGAGGEGAADVIDDQAGGHLAHVIEIPGDYNLEWHAGLLGLG